MPSPHTILPNNRWIIAALLVVATAVWWNVGSDGDEAKGIKQDAVNVSVAPVIRGDVPLQLELVGTVVARESVVVKSRIDSQVVDVLFKDGDFVKEGQPLFELDDRTIKANLSELQAALAKEQAQLINVERQYERAKKLLKTNVVSQAQVDEAKASYEAQAAQVAASKATLDNASVLLTYTTITAPISGRTGTISVTRGNNVKANDTQGLVTINQISPIRVQFAIPQRYYGQVKRTMDNKEGLAIHAKHTESSNDVTGRLEYIENAIDTSNGTFTARASFDNEKETLWPGMFVNITMDLGVEENVLTVPAVAVQGDESKRFVYRVEDGKALRSQVETSITSGNVTVINDGIKEGDTVITDGILRLTEGSPVSVMDKPQ